jgi:hypothetical protein
VKAVAGTDVYRSFTWIYSVFRIVKQTYYQAPVYASFFKKIFYKESIATLSGQTFNTFAR